MQTQLTERLDRLIEEGPEKDSVAVAVIYDLVNTHIALAALTKGNRNVKTTPGLVYLVAILRNHERRPLGVSVGLAARLLEVSERTVRKWLTAGLLRAIPDSKPAKVADASLSRVLMHVSEIRGADNPRFLAEEVAARLDDERLLEELVGAPSDKTDFMRVGDPPEIWADVD